MSGTKFGMALGAALWLSVTAAPAAHAEDDGLLGDPAQVVGDAVEVVDPVVQAVQSTTPQPVPQPAGPVAPPTLAPVTNEVVEHAAAVEREAGRAVEATVRLAEQASQPVVRIVEPTGRRAGEPVAETIDPAVPSSHAPGGSGAAIVPATPRPTDDVSVEDAAPPAPAGSHAPGEARRPPRSAQRRAIDASRSPLAPPRHIVRLGDDPERDQRLWTLTNQLLHMWAGDRAPNGVDAGLAAEEGPGPRAGEVFDVGPLPYGLALAVVAMVLARRGRRAGMVEDRSHRVRAIFDHHVTARPSR